MKLSFVIINHHSEQYLYPCIESIFAARIPFDYEIIIINNDSELSTFSFPEHPNILTVEVGENLGFGKANNRGAAIAKGKYLCFLNSDTLLLPGQNVSEIMRLFENDPNVGIIGPRLATDREKLSAQPWSAGIEISPWDTLINNFGIIRSRKIWTSKKTIAVAWTSGAAMFAIKDMFNKLGGFDERFFMYFEDADLCKRMRVTDKKVLYCPNYSVFHWSGKSSSDKRTKKKYYYASQDYYFKKHFGKAAAATVKTIRKIFTFC